MQIKTTVEGILRVSITVKISSMTLKIFMKEARGLGD